MTAMMRSANFVTPNAQLEGSGTKGAQRRLWTVPSKLLFK